MLFPAHRVMPRHVDPDNCVMSKWLCKHGVWKVNPVTKQDPTPFMFSSTHLHWALLCLLWWFSWCWSWGSVQTWVFLTMSLTEWPDHCSQTKWPGARWVPPYFLTLSCLHTLASPHLTEASGSTCCMCHKTEKKLLTTGATPVFTHARLNVKVI